MKPPLIAPVEVADVGVREPCVLPAVSAVAAGGFLSVALPVIRVGNRSVQRTYVLVPISSRSLLWERHPLRPTGSDPFYLAASDLRPRWIGTNGRSEKHQWINAENLWVRADWLVALCEQVPEPPHGIALLAQATGAALALAGDAKVGVP